MRYLALHGNTYSGTAAQQRWDSYAKSMGFSDEQDMLTCLYKEWSMAAIADLIGVAESTVFYRLRRLGIKTRTQKELGMPKSCAAKRGDPISSVKVEMLVRQHRMMQAPTWAELGRRCGVNEGTAKKYILRHINEESQQ